VILGQQRYLFGLNCIYSVLSLSCNGAQPFTAAALRKTGGRNLGMHLRYRLVMAVAERPPAPQADWLAVLLSLLTFNSILFLSISSTFHFPARCGVCVRRHDAGLYGHGAAASGRELL